MIVEERSARVSEVTVERRSQSIKADGEETRQSSYNSIVCESRRQGLFRRQSMQQQEQSAGPSTGQEAVSKAHGLTGIEACGIAPLVQLR